MVQLVWHGGEQRGEWLVRILSLSNLDAPIEVRTGLTDSRLSVNVHKLGERWLFVNAFHKREADAVLGLIDLTASTKRMVPLNVSDEYRTLLTNDIETSRSGQWLAVTVKQKAVVRVQRDRRGNRRHTAGASL